MDANEKGCLVKVDTRPYRVIAQEHWGLTKEQMRGMHVHHRIPVSQGGTNDPSNLYVCSPSFHRWVWHSGEEWIEWAGTGGKLGGVVGGHVTKEKGVGIFAPGMQSLGGRLGGPRGANTQRSLGTGLFGISSEERSNNARIQWQDPEHRNFMVSVASRVGRQNAENGVGMFSEENLGKGALTTNSTLWMDPQHPELGSHHFNRLKKLQKEHGYPCGRENRVKDLNKA